MSTRSQVSPEASSTGPERFCGHLPVRRCSASAHAKICLRVRRGAACLARRPAFFFFIGLHSLVQQRGKRRPNSPLGRLWLRTKVMSHPGWHAFAAQSVLPGPRKLNGPRKHGTQFQKVTLLLSEAINPAHVPLLLWHGLPTMPPRPTEGLLFSAPLGSACQARAQYRPGTGPRTGPAFPERFGDPAITAGP